jgi:hypothetical protein
MPAPETPSAPKVSPDTGTPEMSAPEQPDGSLADCARTRRTARGARLERVTVNITGRSSRALDLLTQLTGDTKTDAINRALQVYAYMEQVAAHGGSVYVREAVDSELERLKAF